MDTAISMVLEVTAEILTEQYRNYRNLKNAPLVFDLVEAVDERLKEGGVQLGTHEKERLQDEVEKTRKLFRQIEKTETFKGILLGKYTRRLRYARQLKKRHQNFKACFENIEFRKEINEILGRKEKKPRDILQGESLMFWEEVTRTAAGNSEGLVRKRAFWHCYKDLYADDFQVLKGDARKTVERFLLESDSAMISIYGFSAAVCEFDFPFSVSKEAQKLKEDDLTVCERLLLSDKLNALVIDWTNAVGQQVRRDILKPLKCKTINMQGEEEIRVVKEIVNKWYREMKEEEADMSRDNTRRAWNHFFTRFSVLWQLSRFSHELFRAFDFPGRTRVLEFLKYCELMDEANYRIVITRVDNLDRSSSRWKEAERTWKSHRPKVYTFLREWLAERGTKNIPGEVLLGGERTEYEKEKVQEEEDDDTRERIWHRIKRMIKEKEDDTG